MDEQKKSFNKKLIGITALVFLFVAVVLVWYFFYAKPATAPSLGETFSPFSSSNKPGSMFLLNETDEGERLNETETELSQSQTEITNSTDDPLIQIWNKRATGQTFIPLQLLKEETATSTKGTTTVSVTKTIRATSSALVFVDRATGYVYAYSLESRKIFQVTNTLIPGIYDAYIFNEGRRVIMRYVDKEKDEVVAIIAKIPKINETSSISPLEEIEYLNGTVSSVTVSKNDQSASYVVGTKNGSSIYTVKDKDSIRVTSSPFTEWVLSYGGRELYATTKASSYVEGGIFSLPGFYSEISEKTGLVTNPGPGGIIFSSMLSNKGLVTFFTKNNKIIQTSTKTIASKCGWGDDIFFLCGVPDIAYKANENLPDDWYQGSVTFNDSLYQVDPLTGKETKIYSFTKEDGSMDITNISINKNYLIAFINKKDGTLWLLNLETLRKATSL